MEPAKALLALASEAPIHLAPLCSQRCRGLPHLTLQRASLVNLRRDIKDRPTAGLRHEARTVFQRRGDARFWWVRCKARSAWAMTSNSRPNSTITQWLAVSLHSYVEHAMALHSMHAATNCHTNRQVARCSQPTTTLVWGQFESDCPRAQAGWCALLAPGSDDGRFVAPAGTQAHR